SAWPHPRSVSTPPPSVYMQVSRSGQMRRPCIQTSSPVLTTAVTSCSDPASEAPVGGSPSAALTPSRKRAPPTPPTTTTTFTFARLFRRSSAPRSLPRSILARRPVAVTVVFAESQTFVERERGRVVGRDLQHAGRCAVPFAPRADTGHQGRCEPRAPVLRAHGEPRHEQQAAAERSPHGPAGPVGAGDQPVPHRIAAGEDPAFRRRWAAVCPPSAPTTPASVRRAPRRGARGPARAEPPGRAAPPPRRRRDGRPAVPSRVRARRARSDRRAPSAVAERWHGGGRTHRPR